MTTTMLKPETEQQEEKPVLFQPSSEDAREGDLMQFTYWAVVKSARRGYLSVSDVDRPQNADGSVFGGFGVDGEELIQASLSSRQYDREEKVNQTELAKKVLECDRVPFTVCFNTKTRKNRVLQGRLLSGDGFRGYAQVEELVDDNKVKVMHDRIRQVDLRELHYLIVNGVKYVNKTPPAVAS